jgi:hypothetical protein
LTFCSLIQSCLLEFQTRIASWRQESETEAKNETRNCLPVFILSFFHVCKNKLYSAMVRTIITYVKENVILRAKIKSGIANFVVKFLYSVPSAKE